MDLLKTAEIVLTVFLAVSCNHTSIDSQYPEEDSVLGESDEILDEAELTSYDDHLDYHFNLEEIGNFWEEINGQDTPRTANDTLTDSDFDGLMHRYFREHLSYPKTGEEFCKKYYLKDLLNGYDYLMSTCDYAGHRKDFVHPHLLTYQQYNELMDKLYEDIYKKYLDPLHPYYGLLADNHSLPFILIPDWQYIYRNQSAITFSTKGDKLLMKNAADGRIFATENYLYTLPRYVEDTHSIPFDVKRITNLNELRQTNAYTADSTQIELLQFYKYDKMNEEEIVYKLNIAYKFQKKINKLIASKYPKSIIDNDNIRPKRYILQYKKTGEMTDFFTGKSAPAGIANNTELKSYLDYLVSLNPRIAFVQFEAFTLNSH